MQKSELKHFRSPPNSRSINISVSSIEDFENEEYLDHSFKLTMFPSLSTSFLWNSPAPHHRSAINLENLAETLCIECEKKDKIISDLKLSLQSTRSQVILAEKHLKQYDDLLHMKDTRLREEESSLNRKKFDFEQQKLLFKSIAEEIQLEKSKIIIEKQKILKEKKDLEHENNLMDTKRVQLESLLKEYRELKSDYLNLNEIQESISTNITEQFLVKREEEIQRLMEEVSFNKSEIDYYRKHETSFEHHEWGLNRAQSKNSSLKKYENELVRLKALILKEREDQSARFEERMEQIREKEKVLEAAKEKIVEAQKLMNNEIQSIERIKKKLTMNVEITEFDDIKRSPYKRKTMNRKSPMPDIISEFSHESVNTQIKLDDPTQKNDDSGVEIREMQSKLEENDREKTELLSKINQLISEKKEAEEKMKEMAECLEASKLETGQNLSSLTESLMKQRITALETLISVEGKKLKDQIGALTEENKQLKAKNQEINESYFELLNDFDLLKMEKEKFRSISESLHNHINRIKKSTESDVDSDASFDKEFSDLKSELEEKLDLVKNKEVELLNFEEKLSQDREELNRAAEYLKSLGEDLAEKKQEINKETDSLKSEKIKIANLNKRLEEKSFFLAEKEKEIFNLKEKIEEREKLIQSRSVVI